MIWKRLLENKCPTCGSDLEPDGKFIVCSDEECKFKIGQDRMTDIVANLSSQQFAEEEELEDNSYKEGYGQFDLR